MVVIRWKDMFAVLENAIDATETAAQILEGIVIKNLTMSSDVILVIVVGTALAFDFTNGFHDTANVVATSISTGAARPQVAIGIASLLNFVGAFISISVAATVANDVVDAAVITPTIVFAGLIGAIAWNLITWSFGLPSSSSHALIGGVVGSAVAAAGFDAVIADGLVGKVLIPAVVAPILAFTRRRRRDRARLPDRRQAAPRPGHPRLPLRPDRLRRPAGARPRHQRRAEDDGHDHPGADRQRHPGRRRRPAALGDRLRGDGDRARHLHRRLADHPHDRHAGSSRWTPRRASPRRAPAPR